VSNSGRHSKGGRPEDRRDVQVLRAILNHDPAMRQGLGQRRIDEDLRRRFILKRLDSRRTADLSGTLGSR
jgi:hypothetical protein